jgi:hypothetical protein
MKTFFTGTAIVAASLLAALLEWTASKDREQARGIYNNLPLNAD